MQKIFSSNENTSETVDCANDNGPFVLFSARDISVQVVIQVLPLVHTHVYLKQSYTNTMHTHTLIRNTETDTHTQINARANNQ